MQKHFYKNILVLLLLIIAAVLSVYLYNPPVPVSASAPAVEFSSLRAMEHVRNIAQKPHPIGSTEHNKVRGYIINELKRMGLHPEIQATTSISSYFNIIKAAKVQNILVRIKGTSNTGAVLLCAHYDSTPTTLGAADDASGVATLLETIYNLNKSAPLKNDIIFLFTDGEEVGLMGARAFVKEYSLIKDIVLVLNFEGRGNKGPSFTFETSDENGKLISEYSKAAPYPRASSLMYEVYKVMPNNSDLTVFKQAGISGLNFAFIGGLTHYHSMTDTPENLDKGSLQHQGSYALNLVKHFGGMDLGKIKEPNAVYFNTLGNSFIHYPGGLVIPFTILVILLFFSTTFLGFKKKLLTVKGLLLGFLLNTLMLILFTLLITFLWWVIKKVYPDYNTLVMGDIYNSRVYLYGFIFLTAGLLILVMNWVNKKITAHNLAVTSQFIWLLLMITVAFVMPSGSYLFTWPLFFILLGTGILFMKRFEPHSTEGILTLVFFTVPAVILYFPYIVLIFDALSLNVVGAAIFLSVLLLELLMPLVSFITVKRYMFVPVAFLLISLALLISGSISSRFDNKHPMQSSIMYYLDNDLNKASWVAIGKNPDKWNQQFFKDTANSDIVNKNVDFSFRFYKYITAKAPVITLASPQARVKKDTLVDGIRSISLSINSARNASNITLIMENNPLVKLIRVNNKPAEIKGNTDSLLVIQYYGIMNDTLSLLIETEKRRSFKLKVVDNSFKAPDYEKSGYAPMPEDVVITPGPMGTMVSKSYIF